MFLLNMDTCITSITIPSPKLFKYPDSIPKHLFSKKAVRRYKGKAASHTACITPSNKTPSCARTEGACAGTSTHADHTHADAAHSGCGCMMMRHEDETELMSLVEEELAMGCSAFAC